MLLTALYKKFSLYLKLIQQKLTDLPIHNQKKIQHDYEMDSYTGSDRKYES